MKKNLKIKLIILFIVLFSLSHHASAAILDFHLDKNQINTGEILNVTLVLNTEGESINTIEGDLKYDELFLKAEVINIGGSFVSFWVEKPDLKNPGIIHFSGITPGGISMAEGEVFKVIFRAETKGDVGLFLNNVHLFLNDGLGTEVAAKILSKNIKIAQSTNNINESIVLTDTVFPEKFSIMRTKDPTIFDNKWFIVFSTVDKGSGVDHYEVCEFWSCRAGESPYLLKYQNPFYHITVRAYDLNGNFTSSTLTSIWLASILALLLLIVIIYLCFYLRKKLSRK